MEKNLCNNGCCEIKIKPYKQTDYIIKTLTKVKKKQVSSFTILISKRFLLFNLEVICGDLQKDH